MVPPDLPSEPHADRVPFWRRRLLIVSVTVVATLTLSAVASGFVPTPYYAQSPGTVRNTEPLISVEGAATFTDDNGEIGYTTVRLGPATLLEVMGGVFDEDVRLVPERDVIGVADPEENRQLNLQMMVDSKNVAAAVALRSLGYEVPESGDGAVIVEVGPDAPATGILSPGDTITAVDGTDISFDRELSAAIAAHAPGDTISLTVVPATGAATRTDEVVLGTRPGGAPEDPPVAFLGVASSTSNLSYDLPFTVDIDSADVGGPSAGLAFSLGVIDVLTPGSLSGGGRVATTGTIDIDGKVGPIGGIEQKVAAVIDAGIGVFLVPAGEGAAARVRAGDDVRIIEVGSLDEALAALADLGGDTSGVTDLAAGAPTG